MHYLSSCSIVKNEDNYIQEFIKIHRALGVEHFLFYDRSDNPLENVFKGEKDITVINFPEPLRHADAWLAGLNYFIDKSRWVQFIDIDQVLFPTQTNDIKVFLQNYEQFSGIGLNWHTFGGNGYEVEPTISTYEAYTKRATNQEPINNHLQSVVNPNEVLLQVPNDPHHFLNKNNNLQYNENGQPIPYNSPFNIPPTQDLAFIAHYYTRSKDYYAKKIAKNRADTGTSAGKIEDYDNHQLYMNKVDDTRIKEFWEKIK